MPQLTGFLSGLNSPLETAHCEMGRIELCQDTGSVKPVVMEKHTQPVSYSPWAEVVDDGWN